MAGDGESSGLRNVRFLKGDSRKLVELESIYIFTFKMESNLASEIQNWLAWRNRAGSFQFAYKEFTDKAFTVGPLDHFYNMHINALAIEHASHFSIKIRMKECRTLKELVDGFYELDDWSRLGQ